MTKSNPIKTEGTNSLIHNTNNETYKKPEILNGNNIIHENNNNGIISKNIESNKIANGNISSNLNSNTKGNLESDVPLKIINAKILDDSDVNINCLIKWKPRLDGFVPMPDWISSKILKRKYPDVLFDFYESRIKFPKKENTNK